MPYGEHCNKVLFSRFKMLRKVDIADLGISCFGVFECIIGQIGTG